MFKILVPSHLQFDSEIKSKLLYIASVLAIFKSLVYNTCITYKST